MIRFNSGEICNLLRACECYKEKTGSEFMWDVFDDLQKKLESYGEEACAEKLSCPPE